MRRCVLVLLLVAAAADAGEPAGATTTVNYLAASEFAGLGAGLEYGGKYTLVLGAGAGFAALGALGGGRRRDFRTDSGSNWLPHFGQTMGERPKS